jgi:hypothetical protein
VGILLLLGGFRQWQIGSASVTWPTAQAEITRAKLVKRFFAPTLDEIAFAVYDREISVRYTVEGVEYTSDFRLPANESNTPAKNPSRSVTASARDIEHITLYYDPENPHEVVLHPGDQTAAVRGVVCGAITTAVCSLFVFLLGSWLSRHGANG